MVVIMGEIPPMEERQMELTLRINLTLDFSYQSQIDDYNSPFYLSNDDYLGLSLVYNPLIGSNYNSLSRAMTMALIAKNKMCFVNGSISRLEIDDSLYNFWSRCNNMVMSQILNVVSKNIAYCIMYVDNSVEMWIYLHD